MLFQYSKSYWLLFFLTVHTLQGAHRNLQEKIDQALAHHQNFIDNERKLFHTAVQNIINHERQWFDHNKAQFLEKIDREKAKIDRLRTEAVKKEVRNFWEIVVENYTVYAKATKENFIIEADELAGIKPTCITLILQNKISQLQSSSSQGGGNLSANEGEKVQEYFKEEQGRYEKLLLNIVSELNEKVKFFHQDQGQINQAFLKMFNSLVNENEYAKYVGNGRYGLYQSSQLPFKAYLNQVQFGISFWQGSYRNMFLNIKQYDVIQRQDQKKILKKGIAHSQSMRIFGDYISSLPNQQNSRNTFCALLFPFSGNKAAVIEQLTGQTVKVSNEPILTFHSTNKYETTHISLASFEMMTGLDTDQAVANKVHETLSNLDGNLSCTSLLVLLDYDATFSGNLVNQWGNLKKKILPLLCNLFADEQLQSPNSLLTITHNSWLLFTNSQNLPPTTFQSQIEQLIQAVYQRPEITKEDINLAKFLEQVVQRSEHYVFFGNRNQANLVIEQKNRLVNSVKNAQKKLAINQVASAYQARFDYRTDFALPRKYYSPLGADTALAYGNPTKPTFRDKLVKVLAKLLIVAFFVSLLAIFFIIYMVSRRKSRLQSKKQQEKEGIVRKNLSDLHHAS